MYPSNRNSVLGAGYLFFDELLDAITDQHAGERYIANTPSLELNVTAGGNVQDWDADAAIASLIFDVDTQVSRSLTFTAKHIDGSNLALFLPGDVATRSPAAGALTAQVVNAGDGVKQGYWYQLGADLYAGGIRAITTVAIKDAVPTTYDITDDYLLDATMGRIYIVPGGAIADDTVLTADFTKTAVDWQEIAASSQLQTVRGRLRFISANTAGEQRDLFVPDCILTPNGAMAWKSRDTVQTMSFNARVQQPPDGSSPVVITNRAVAQ